MNTVSRRFFVHAPNIHSGGGRALLTAMLAAWTEGLHGVVQVDQRMSLVDLVSDNLRIRNIPPTILHRLLAEWWLRTQAKEEDLVLCFGNLPPLFRLRGQVVIFLQNRYLVDAVSLSGFPWKTRLRLELERRWFSWCLANAQAIVVQTPSMQRLLECSGMVHKQIVSVQPFVNTSQGYCRGVDSTRARQNPTRMLYVASGEPHKNHRRLVQAWCQLASEGLFPTLWLTLDIHVNRALCAWIEQQKEHYNLQIENLGVQPHSTILQLYTRVQAMIFPSLFESFGIPLIEARQAHLPILAAELDYVRDVVDAEQVFDPTSAISIARAVKRFMGVEEKALPLLDARQFLLNILNTFE